MVENKKNERTKGKYFLDRRNFIGSSEPLPEGITKPKLIKDTSSEENELEGKLKNLYESLGTSFWDEEKPKERKQKAVKKPTNYSKKVGRYSNKASVAAKSKYKHLTSTPKRARVFYGTTAALLLVLAVWYINRPEPQAGTIATVKSANVINASNAGYSPLLPKGADKLDNARSTLQYNPDKKVFTYDSSVGNGKYILISQQPMPQEYQKDPISGLGAIASNVGATDWLASSKGKIYLAPNEGGSGQTATFTYKNILVLMRSTVNVSQEQWRNFADQLE